MSRSVSLLAQVHLMITICAFILLNTLLFMIQIEVVLIRRLLNEYFCVWKLFRYVDIISALQASAQPLIVNQKHSFLVHSRLFQSCQAYFS